MHYSEITPGVRPWGPILEGDLRAQAEEALEATAEGLRNRPCAGVSLAGGSAGVALFFAWLAGTQPGRGWDTVAMERLGEAMDAMGEGLRDPAFYEGFTGLAWVLNHLRGRFLDEDGLEGIDEALVGWLDRTPWPGPYDLVSGLVGYGLYGLERPTARRLVEAVVARLGELAVPLVPGLAWLTPAAVLPELQRAQYPRGTYDLGMAHGVAGIIGFLGQACAQGHAPARPLLEGAVSWLRGQRLEEGLDSVYPPCLPPEGAAGAVVSRVAWCYGDLGIAMALLTAGHGLGRDDWSGEALAFARKAAERTFEASGVRDPALCHGAAGNAHLFNRLFHATGEESFLRAARTWLQRVLAYQIHRGSGFAAWIPPGGVDAGAPREGLLAGGAGIGLALQAALSDQEPAWDRLLGFALTTSLPLFNPVRRCEPFQGVPP